MSIEIKKLDTLFASAKKACDDTIADVKEARESGDKFAIDLVQSLHVNQNVEKVLQGSASLMSQMVSGGFTLLMCPMKNLSKGLAAK